MDTLARPWDRLGLWMLVILAVLLPFELETPWMRLGPLSLTNVEIVLGGVFLITAMIGWRSPPRNLGIHHSWFWLGGLFITGLFLSSLFAPSFSGNAFKATFRTISGILLVLVVPVLVRTRRAYRAVVTGIIAGGLVASLIGMAESIHGSEFAWLTLFRKARTLSGPFLRLAGTFDHANQAAMFIEASIPLLLVGIWIAYTTKRRFLMVTLIAIALIYLEASFLTWSRSSFATIFASMLLTAVLLRRSFRARYLCFGSAAVVLLFVLVNVLVSPIFRLRLSSEGDNEWYQAGFDAPAALNVPAGETVFIPVTITNLGALTWQSDGAYPINLSARWFHPATNQQLTYEPRWSLERVVKPGESISMTVPLATPAQGGDYQLIWDLVQEQVTWFGAKTGMEVITQVTVTGIVSASQATDNPLPAATFTQAYEIPAPIPGRRVLWSLALQLFSTYPLSGIGLDNFRLTYGGALGYDLWNEAIHTNNWYLETLVSSGLVGSLPFFVWLALLAIDIMRTLRQRHVTIWQMGTAVGLIAYFIHGLLDYFLLFNATALLFWLLVGLWISQKNLARETGDDSLKASVTPSPTTAGRTHPFTSDFWSPSSSKEFG